MGAASRLERILRSLLAAVPRRARLALVEVILLVLVLVIFTRVHAAEGTDAAVATTNADALQSVERALHLDVELGMNRWLAEHEGLIGPAVLIYRVYYAALLGVAIWVFLRHADVYPHIRRTFVAMSGLALVAFWVLPMAPPRFTLAGVVDVVAEHDIFGSRSSRDIGNGENHFSAMPSLHVGWSAWCAYAAWLALRRTYPRAALLTWVFPLAMIAVVLATGNHYLLDVVGSGVLLTASIAVANGWDRLVKRWARTWTNR
ncbi:MAG: phosphatase PAP2 family protein [Jatrophihabitans sp.]